jgi:hypothetical protein
MIQSIAISARIGVVAGDFTAVGLIVRKAISCRHNAALTALCAPLRSGNQTPSLLCGFAAFGYRQFEEPSYAGKMRFRE